MNDRAAASTSGRWLYSIAVALLLLPVAAGLAAVQEPRNAFMLVAADAAPPAAGRPWQPVLLPDLWSVSRPDMTPAATWYRVIFDYSGPDPPTQPWAVYLPYFYNGGEVWLNDALAGAIPSSSESIQVRWARPHLVTLPLPALRSGANQLMVRAAQPRRGSSLYMPRIGIGPQAELTPIYNRRLFWVSTTPEITAAICFLVALFVLFIWWRRRVEVLYGLFGLAAALWGIRTLTFVIEEVPTQWYHLWRLTYLGATGGFIVMMALIALRLAGSHKPWVERLLAAYWLLGPAWLLLRGPAAEPQVNRWWVLGFVPIGIAILAVSILTVWRQRTLKAALLPAAMTAAVLAGIHDYIINWDAGIAAALLPEWSRHRVFLLHHGADLVLLAMGWMLTARFVQTLSQLEEMNQTLESRIADRERKLADNYGQVAALQRERVAVQERQRIMRDLHDGLGSQLFTSLLRVERGDMNSSQLADTLRACIADMRLSLDTLTPNNHDFRATLGEFMFRWQTQLLPAGVHPGWTIDVPDAALRLSPHASLQILRVAQEALTNVLKHAHASRVEVRLRQAGDELELEVQDDGTGGGNPHGAARGRGIGNMRARAEQLGGVLRVQANAEGTCVALRVPIKAVLA